MIVTSAKFITSATKQNQYSDSVYPEISISGRSNAGKSSFINALTNRKHLVKISSTPGRTQLINFFLINNSISLVDLPGYGYAKVPKNIQKKWGPMIETYFKTRKNLKANILIMDVRRKPQKEEFNLINWLNLYLIPTIPILTKTDKISKNKLFIQLKMFETELNHNKTNLILFSSKTKKGRNVVWSTIKNLLKII